MDASGCLALIAQPERRRGCKAPTTAPSPCARVACAPLRRNIRWVSGHLPRWISGKSLVSYGWKSPKRRNFLQPMPYQYKREPLNPDEANRLASCCETHQERLIISTLRDTGLRVAELAGLTRDQIDWQNHRLMIYGKGGPYGTRSKRRVVPSPPHTTLLEFFFPKMLYKFVGRNNACALIRFHRKEVFITGNEIVSLCLTCTHQKFIILSITTRLLELRLANGQHTDVKKLTH